MENIVYNELQIRGYNVDVGIVDVFGKNKEGQRVRKQLEVDFVVNQSNQRYYIQAAYDMNSEEKQESVSSQKEGEQQQPYWMMIRRGCCCSSHKNLFNCHFTDCFFLSDRYCNSCLTRLFGADFTFAGHCCDFFI